MATSSSPSNEAFSLSPLAFLARHFAPPEESDVVRPATPTFLATGAIVFDRPSTETDPKILLIRRAPHDSKPLLWETPGGGCDDTDESVLHSCARELKEEAGLEASVVGVVVPCPRASAEENSKIAEVEAEWGQNLGGQFFFTRKGKLVCKFYFVVEVKPDQEVMVDPKEHVAHVWATEEEVRNKKIEGVEGVQLEFTTREQFLVLLEAFELRRKGEI
ncbi:NUDIX hydrolase domain-like protein [Podospora didyma]|uniref:NUDIX hydrolase domain-like protein n=1 Tax=Podospora didyma TaxID=330526 RepID=A0AAE0NBL9_9PEZI|nr:NUDIX hydrolase domain-like protein [Podospora didyma]